MLKASLKWGMTAVLLVAAFAGGLWQGRHSTGAGGRKVLYWVDPMHPAYRADKPGTAPDCGMQLEPVYEDGGPAEPAAKGRDLPFGTVRVSAARQQLIGVRVEPVRRWSGVVPLRTTGRVAPDENRSYRVNASTEMWIRKVYPPTTGSVVRRDDPLLAFYATNFVTVAQSYLYALNTRDRFLAAKGQSQGQEAVVEQQTRNAVESLQNLGMSNTQIAEMRKARRVPDFVDVRSPTDGFILQRTASLGEWVGPGTELYRISDLSHVWVLADLFENEAHLVKPGTRVRISLPHRDLYFTGVVARVPPLFEAATRTLKVRLEVDNPRLALWPDMFVDVEFPVQVPDTLVVPATAVLDSGRSKTVFVDLGDGYFEPRSVETGARFGDRVAVTRGLMTGERIVVSGNFLLDSESRMRAAALGIRGTPDRCAVCDMDLDQERARAAGRTRAFQGQTYYFCSGECLEEFDRAPGGRPRAKPGPSPAPLAGTRAHEHAGASSPPTVIPGAGDPDLVPPMGAGHSMPGPEDPSAEATDDGAETPEDDGTGR